MMAPNLMCWMISPPNKYAKASGMPFEYMLFLRLGNLLHKLDHLQWMEWMTAS